MNGLNLIKPLLVDIKTSAKELNSALVSSGPPEEWNKKKNYCLVDFVTKVEKLVTLS